MTIKDIAQLSGCGVATVSRVLNNHPDVREETRQKVLAVIQECGFRPNNNAKHLKQQTATSIAVIVKGTYNMLFADILERIQSLLRDSDRDASVYYLDEEANEVAYASQLCRERKPLGIFFLGGDLELFRKGFHEIRVPCVLLTNTAEDLGFANLSSLTTDDEAASEQAVEYLIRRGHRNIGLLGGNLSCSQIGYQRMLGCWRSFRRHEIPFDEAVQCEQCRYSMDSAYAATGRLLARFPDLTAIFAVSDVMAIGCIRALKDLGKRVPEDISVVGYDGIPMASYSVPRLTTIKQDAGSFAQRGVDLLLEAIAQSKAPPRHELVPFQLVEGESVSQLN